MQFRKRRFNYLVLLTVFMLLFTVSSDSFGVTSIWDAARMGELKDVKLQIEKVGADVDSLDGMGNTPLIYAIVGGCPSVVEYLISKGADLNRTVSYSGDLNFSGIDSGECNYIQFAVIVWRKVLIRYNQNGGRSGRGHHVGVPPLFENAQCIKLIMDANKKQNLQLSLPVIDSIDMAVILGDLDAVKRYVKAGIGITGFSLRYCVGFDDVEILKYFDSIGFISERDTGSYEELIREGAEQNSYKCLSYFFESGKSPDCKDNKTTPLIAAAREDNINMFKYLLEKGADAGQSPTALHVAASRNNFELVKLILANGVKIDAGDSVKMTPLHHAAEAGHLEMVKFLIENGANPVASGNSALPYDMASKNKHQNVMDFLKPYTDKYYDKFK